MLENVYTLKEISEHLNISERALRKFVHEGRLKATKIGNTYRVTEKHFNEFVDPNKNNRDDLLKGRK